MRGAKPLLLVALTHFGRAFPTLFTCLPKNLTISKKSVLKTDLAEDLPAVRANAPQLRQIVMNLVTNASEAVTEEGGVITVTTTRVSRVPAPVAKSATDLSGGDYARLEVSDTGCGMSEEVQKRMFDPFFTTKPPGKGTGLGLAISYGIVRDHSGEIRVSKAVHGGATFTIVLPAKG